MQNFLFGVVFFTMLIALSIAVYRHKRFPTVLKKVTWYLLVEFIAQTAVFSVLWYQKRNEYIIFHISFFLEATTLLLIYREIFKKYIEEKKRYVYRKIFIALIALYTLFAVVNALCWQSIHIYPSNTRAVLSMIIIILNILYIYKHTVSEPVPRTGLELTNYQASRVSLFWIITGLLLFHSLSFFQYMYTNVLRTGAGYTNILNAHVIFTILLYAFIAIGLLKGQGIIILDKDNNKINKHD